MNWNTLYGPIYAIVAVTEINVLQESASSPFMNKWPNTMQVQKFAHES